MKQEYALQGLQCAHCAGKIEAAVQKLPGVSSASVNLMKQQLTLEAEQDMTAQVKKIVKQLEPDVKVSREKPAGNAPERSGRVWRLIGGGVLLAVGLGLQYRKLPWISFGFLLAAYLVAGYDVIFKAVKNLFRGQVFDENFLMSLSTAGAFAIGEYPEAAAVMLLYQLGELLQEMAVQRSRRSVASLMDLRCDSARVLRNGAYVSVSPEEVSPGEVLQLRPGEKVPLDALVLEGHSSLDTRALTGEAVPRNVAPGDPVISGCVNLDGVLTVKVTKSAEASTVSQILELVENASASKAPAENFITTFARYYTPVVVILAALLAVVPPLVLGQSFAPWLRRCFVFLVVSCPCALVLSVPLTFFGGIGAASRHGILVKGSNYLQALSRLDTVVFDKTGTLTKGEFRVQRVLPQPGFTEAELIRLAARGERLSGHPIARSILSSCPDAENLPAPEEYREYPGKGVSLTDQGQRLLCGSVPLLRERDIPCPDCQEPGVQVHVAVDGRYVGCILIADTLKPDSADALQALKRKGVRRTVILTGDDRRNAEEAAKALKPDLWYARLLPADKVARLEQLAAQVPKGRKIAFVGDGINDAPVLARSDVGIAMGGLGSDAAIEAADVVLMTDEPSRLAEAVDIAKATRRIVLQNILFALSVKGLCLLLGALGLAGMWSAVFADVGVTLLAVLNALRMLRK